jgi:iron complex outermembrane receptor protein
MKNALSKIRLRRIAAGTKTSVGVLPGNITLNRGTSMNAGLKWCAAQMSLCLAAGLALPQQPAWSQTAAAPAGDELQEVVVTAQRRSENLQDVAIAISVVKGQEFANSNFREIADLQYLVPSLKYDPDNGSGYAIRGVGTNSFDLSSEQSVSLVLDDVVLDAPPKRLFGLGDVDHIEVLRGPQGTLFGKNSTSGVISVTTKNPVLGQLFGDGSVSYGERNDRDVHASINLPLADQWALRLSAFEVGQDGYGNYTLLDKKLGSNREAGGRGKLLFEPSDAFDAVLTADYSYVWNNSRGQGFLVKAGSPMYAAISAANGAVVGPNNTNNADVVEGFTTVEDGGLSLKFNYRFAGLTLTSITAYRYDGQRDNAPIDFVPAPLFLPYNVGDLQTHKISQEFRLASPTGRFFEYVAGLFYNDLEVDGRLLQAGDLGSTLPPLTYIALSGVSDGVPNNDLAVTHNKNRNEAAFGQVKLNFTEQFDISAGGRVTHDNVYADIGYEVADFGPNALGYTLIGANKTPVPSASTVTATRFTYQIAPEYHFSKDVMGYFTYSTGYKGPGIAYVSSVYDPFRPETVTSYELGVKSELLDHRLRLNADIFDEKFKDFQAQIAETLHGAPVFVTGNAGGLTSKGVESDFSYRPIAPLTINGAVTYLEAYFTNYIDGPNNYSGNNLINSPRWSSGLSTDFTQPVGGGYQAVADLNYAWRAHTYINIGQQVATHVGGYGLMGGRLSIGPEQGHWKAGVYGRNLLNKYYPEAFFSFAVGTYQSYTPDGRRTIGAFFEGSF